MAHADCFNNLLEQGESHGKADETGETSADEAAEARPLQMGTNKVAPRWHDGAKPGDEGRMKFGSVLAERRVMTQPEKREKAMAKIAAKRNRQLAK